MAQLWVYKCSKVASNGGDWEKFFSDPRVQQPWGGTRNIRNASSLKILREKIQQGDLVLAWQKDRQAAVGLCRVLRLDRRGTEVEIVLKTLKPFPSPVELLKWKKRSRPLQQGSAFRPARMGTLFETTSEEADEILRVCGVSEYGRELVASRRPKDIEVGAGFGDPVENKLVESAAIRAVTRDYTEDGWSVRSVERDKCGFDLECCKDPFVENVEVKGVRGTEPCFIITAGEVEQARNNPRLVLMVVTSALSASPKLTKYSGAEFSRRFDLSAIQYRAVLMSCSR